MCGKSVEPWEFSYITEERVMGNQCGALLIMNVRILHFLAIPLLSCSVVSNSLKPHDCSPPGSFISGIFKARILEWVSISSSRNYTPRYVAKNNRYKRHVQEYSQQHYVEYLDKWNCHACK